MFHGYLVNFSNRTHTHLCIYHKSLLVTSSQKWNCFASYFKIGKHLQLHLAKSTYTPCTVFFHTVMLQDLLMPCLETIFLLKTIPWKSRHTVVCQQPRKQKKTCSTQVCYLLVPQSCQIQPSVSPKLLS